MPDCEPICLPSCSAVRGVGFARVLGGCRGGDTGDVTIGRGVDQRPTFASAHRVKRGTDPGYLQNPPIGGFFYAC